MVSVPVRFRDGHKPKPKEVIMDKFTNLIEKQANGGYLEVYHKNELFATFEYFAGPVFVGYNYSNSDIDLNDEYTPQELGEILDHLKREYNVNIVGENAFNRRWR